jgi:hypothetical protein
MYPYRRRGFGRGKRGGRQRRRFGRRDGAWGSRRLSKKRFRRGCHNRGESEEYITQSRDHVRQKMHRLTIAVGLAEGKEVGVNVVGFDVGVELGVTEGCTKIGLDDITTVRK